AADPDLDGGAEFRGSVAALGREFDDYLRPEEARKRFARVPQAEVIGVDGAKHLWVGEPYVRIVLNAIVERVAPQSHPLPTEWDGEYTRDTGASEAGGHAAGHPGRPAAAGPARAAGKARSASAPLNPRAASARGATVSRRSPPGRGVSRGGGSSGRRRRR